MNKYSSKAVKTAATVGMSLAMVLSNAAPVFAAEAGNYDAGVCKNVSVADIANPTATEKEKCGQAVYQAIIDKLDGKKFDTITLDDDLKVKNGAGDSVHILVAIKEYDAELTEAVKDLEWTSTVATNVSKWQAAVAGIEAYIGDIKTDFDDDTKFPVAGSKLKVLIGKLDGEWSTIDSDAEYTAAKASLKEIKDFKKDFGKYLGTELEDGPVNTAGSVVLDAYNALNDVIDTYLGTTDDTALGEFVLAFDAILQKDLKEEAVDLTAKISKKSAKSIGDVLGSDYGADDFPKMDLSKSTIIKNRMKSIKDHDSYDRFKDEDAVINILDTYEELLDNITTTKDVYKSDEYKDYTTKKVAVNGETTKKTVKAFVSAIAASGKADYTEGDMSDDLAATLNLDQWEILKAVKEEVIDSVYSMETKKVGKYYSDNSDFLSTVTSSQQTTFNNNFASYLYTLVDKEEGKFGYDVVAEHMEAFEKALAAVTTDIAKLTPANIKVTDKKLLEAAEDAIYELGNSKGDFYFNTTKDEEKTVRAAETKIENLREAFDNLGTTNVAGWYDMGNGNWGYNNEDGTPAAYKWVASGSDWYMIKDGKMLRNTWLATDGGRWYYLDNAGKMVTNQSVDGCWINSYSVYMSPSYNG